MKPYGLRWVAVLTVLSAAALASGPAAPPAAVEADGVVVREAWVQEGPPRVLALAGYPTIENRASKTVALIAASSPDFNRIEIHRTDLEGTMAVMTLLPRLTLAPGQTIRFQPNGHHLMLIQPKRALRAGMQVRLELAFDNGRRLAVSAPVRRGDAPPSH